MAGKHDDFIAKRKYFFSDPAYQQINISTRQITSTDAGGKKNVAADKQSIFTRKEAKATRTMPGNFQHLEPGAKEISAWRFFDKKIRFRRFNFELETEVPKKFPLGNHWRGERVTTYPTIKLPLDPGNILNVIDMPVCQEQKLRVDIKRLNPFAGPIGRIEKNPALRSLKQIAIRFENAAAKPLVNHCGFHCTWASLQLKARVLANI